MRFRMRFWEKLHIGDGTLACEKGKRGTEIKGVKQKKSERRRQNNTKQSMGGTGELPAHQNMESGKRNSGKDSTVNGGAKVGTIPKWA